MRPGGLGMSRSTLNAVTLLPEPGLADEPEHFAGAHVEVDAVDGLGHAGLGIEVGAQPANGE